MYNLIRSILFGFDPEKVHYFTMNMLSMLIGIKPIRYLIEKKFRPRRQLPVHVFNLDFPNPVGLGAGFDKNARYLTELSALGFGFVEIGTVTPQPQIGNEKPRLFRLPEDKALINRMGFNNDGAEAVAKRLAEWRKKEKNNQLIIGGNIGKNKTTAQEDAWKDYLICFNTLHDAVDYFVVNVSSPNTPGLRALQEKESLEKIFSALRTSVIQQNNPKPILLKIAPDLAPQQLDELIQWATETHLDGLIVSNTTIAREGLNTAKQQIEKIGAGGLSGQPLEQKSTNLIQYIHSKTEGKLTIIGSGGIFSSEDAARKIKAGATLLQVWTGFVYEGPGILKKIVNDLNGN